MKKQQNILHIIVLEVAHTFIGMYSVFNSTVPNAQVRCISKAMVTRQRLRSISLKSVCQL